MNLKTDVTFITACAVSDDIVYISTILDVILEEYADEANVSRMFIYDFSEGIEGWYYHDVNFLAISVCYHNKHVYALGEEGCYEVYDGEESTYSFIDGSGLNEKWSYNHFGYLSTIKIINNQLFVLGYDSQIYCNTPEWRLINNGLSTKSDSSINILDQDNISVLDICKRDHLLFCVGHVGGNGLIAVYNDTKWEILEKSVTILCAILTLESGIILCAGYSGNLILIDHDNSIKNLSNEDIQSGFYSLTEFLGKVYIGSESGIYCLNDFNLEKIDVNDLINNSTIIKVEATEKYLWVFSEKHILRFDGSIWQIIEHPDNNEDLRESSSKL